MAGRIPDSFIEEINRRADLVGIVRDRVDLKKSGGSWTGRCPFHNEKTPSFHVYESGDAPHYHCYGCEAHGNTISFLMELDNLDFVSAVETVAGRLGLEVPREHQDSERYDALKSAYAATEKAAELYIQALAAAPDSVHEYLQRRGIDSSMASLYGLGYAPPAGHLLSRNDQTQGLRNALSDLGLTRGQDGAEYDQFRNRLMFPIRDQRGRTIGFGGRTLGDDKAKYINSADSDIFSKSQVVYGLWETGQQFRGSSDLLVVEGYLDVIALTQHDIPGAVATMGTATNEDSLQRLLSLSDRITFCFDGDSAGISAARKAMEKILPFLEDGHRIAFLLLPDGEDPDTHVRRIGSKRMSEALEQALPLSLFLFRVLGQNLDLAIAEDKSLLFKRGKALLATMNRQKAPTLLNGLREDLWKATRERYQQGKTAGAGQWQGRYQSKNPVTTLSFANLMQSFNGVAGQPARGADGRAGPREATMLARSLAVGLLKNPAEAERIGPMTELDVDAESERDAIALADWIESNGIATTGDLLYALAANPELAARLEYLFDVSELDGSLAAGADKTSGQQSDEQERQARQLQDTIEQMRRNYTRSTLARIEQSLRLRPDDVDLKARYRRLMTELTPRVDK